MGPLGARVGATEPWGACVGAAVVPGVVRSLVGPIWTPEVRSVRVCGGGGGEGRCQSPPLDGSVVYRNIAMSSLVVDADKRSVPSHSPA